MPWTLLSDNAWHGTDHGSYGIRQRCITFQALIVTIVKQQPHLPSAMSLAAGDGCSRACPRSVAETMRAAHLSEQQEHAVHVQMFARVHNVGHRLEARVHLCHELARHLRLKGNAIVVLLHL